MEEKHIISLPGHLRKGENRRSKQPKKSLCDEHLQSFCRKASCFNPLVIVLEGLIKTGLPLFKKKVHPAIVKKSVIKQSAVPVLEFLKIYFSLYCFVLLLAG